MKQTRLRGYAAALALSLTAGGCVVAGEDAYAEDWPGIVSLQVSQGRMTYHSCGGTMITKEWLLTAAHCVDQARIEPSGRAAQFERGDDGMVRRLGPLKVAANHTHLSEDEVTRLFSVTEVHVHPDYVSGAYQRGADIALLKISRGYDGPVMRVAGLGHDVPQLGEGDAVQVAGYGNTTERDTSRGAVNSRGWAVYAPSLRLQQGDVPVIETAACRTMMADRIADYGFEDDFGDFTVDEMTLCAGGGETDSCYGDSGGPLVARDIDYTPIQVGIVSWGLGCARAESPGIYTRTSAYSGWIMDTIGPQGAEG